MSSEKRRTALVCGASQGIGFAIAQAFARRGYQLVTLARRGSVLESQIPGLKELGAPHVWALPADLENVDSLQSSLSNLLSQTGPIEVLVNNAGGPPPGPLLEAQPADFLKAFYRLLLSSHVLVQLCLPGMKKTGFGRIVNVVSTSVREPIPGLGVSNTIRGATASWSKTLSGELPPGITINNVLPGATATERLDLIKADHSRTKGVSPSDIEKGWIETIPERRIASPREIAEVVAFLVSAEASYIRGISLPVDGGRTKAL